MSGILTREEVERGLAYIEAHEYLKAKGALNSKLPTHYEALQTVLSLYARAEEAEQERDTFRTEAMGMREALENLTRSVGENYPPECPAGGGA